MKAKAIQDAIRRMAILSHLTDGELAAIAGCGREHMNKFRGYRTNAGLEMLCALADHFGLEICVKLKPHIGCDLG